ncbi:midnolin [Latimeria chalumnae]|uniref:Midnolin n=1 Tax=Latimeria chalumnae TaxID=7897 RepID=H3AK88_LATCH|nr:PREDICTED: midnolin [Latimeria chalumnae]XP_005996384.1 PREDICTED: midnolin [Latimeria chalumnae]|eukprot:XP_005996383.1 PREDICTED: midnolin [Latimeria chalumnae]
MDQHPSARSCSRRATACEAISNEPSMNLHINTTTGTRYELSVPLEETVEGLKRRLSQRLKVPKERLALLHKETRLNSGKLQDFGITDGSKLTLVPTVEAGLMSQASRPEQSVMQALESLTETQVNDFLSGRSPLTLALRIGDHMMFVQLQLAAQQTGSQLQHRHVIASRGDNAGATGPSGHHRQPHSGTSSNFSHIPVSTCQQTSSSSAVPSTPTAPMYCNTAHPSPVTSGMFRSHGTSTSTANHNIASPCPEADCTTRSSSSSSSAVTSRSRKPGAIIESFVNHAPGVFSGTFSGTLHPNCQDSSGRPRRDIGTILQILNDLLSATRHYQGVPQSLTQLRCQTQCAPSSPPPSLPSLELSTKTTSEKTTAQPLHSVVQCQSQIRMCKPNGDRLRQTENRATRCKVERLQLLMQQKRLRRKARRDARAPYQWLPNRKSSRTNSNSSVSSEGSLDLDFEDSVWKPEVKADMKSEFVVA